jgi:UDP-N-acetylmuramoyl-tripeptide--D-alanyl-D-alanine ligase
VQPYQRELITRYLFFWARLVLRRHKPRIVGITGSVGKTTTKDTIAAVLTHPDVRPTVGAVRATPLNMNNNVLLPATVLGYETPPLRRAEWFAVLRSVPLRALRLLLSSSYPKILVLEYGAGAWGDIGRMVKLAPPTVGVITAIGPSHLSWFKTVEGVARAKSALIRDVPQSGLVILGEDNPIASAMDRETRAPVVKVPGRGPALSRNIARVVARYFGVSDEVVDRALQRVGATTRRLDVIDVGALTVIDDSYNANPLSMALGLDTLLERARPGQRRVAVLGMMATLGPEAARYHEDIAAHARACADVVIGVGELARHYRPDHWFATSTECADELSKIVRHGDCLLVKGSHSVELNLVVRRLVALAADGSLTSV